jgi:hypothetical protein
VIFAYIAPEVVLPVASVLAGIMGFLMMVGRAPIRFTVRSCRWVVRGVRSIVKRLEF